MQGLVGCAVVVIIVGCATNVLALSDEMKEMAAMLHKTCVEETGVKEELIAGTMQGNFPAEENELKCYMKCILTQTASMGDDGIIDVEATIAMLPDELQDEIPDTMRKCGTVTGADNCENAFLTNKCWYDNSPSKYFLI